MTDYNKNLPSGSQALPVLDDACRDNYAALEERLSQEHRFPANAEDPDKQRGRHAFFVGDQAACDAQFSGFEASGMVRYNLTLFAWEVYDGTAWRSVSDAGIIGEVKYLTYRPGALPFGWLHAEGQQVAQATYQRLFAAIGHTYQYGNPDPSPNFYLPDLRRRLVAGYDDGGIDWASVMGELGGEKEVTLQTSEVPPNESESPGMSGPSSFDQREFGISNVPSQVHTHVVNSHDHAPTSPAPQPHENRPPYIALNGIIYAGA